MTEQEVYNELKASIKPYIGVMNQGTFSNYMIRFKAGLLKPATIESFFTKCGYKKNNKGWIKGK
jgi:hypothetical protein